MFIERFFLIFNRENNTKSVVNYVSDYDLTKPVGELCLCLPNEAYGKD